MKPYHALLLVIPLLSTSWATEETSAKKDSVIHIDVSQATQILASPDKRQRPYVIDIRTPEEFKAGHLSGAMSIDFLADNFSTKIRKLDRDTPYLVHCQSGGRSSNSLTLWTKLGFTKIYHLDGGLLAWKKAGLPVVK